MGGEGNRSEKRESIQGNSSTEVWTGSSVVAGAAPRGREEEGGPMEPPTAPGEPAGSGPCGRATARRAAEVRGWWWREGGGAALGRSGREGGKLGRGGQDTARLACWSQPKAATPSGSGAPRQKPAGRGQGGRGTRSGALVPPDPQPRSAGGPSVCSEHSSGRPISCGSGCALLPGLGLSAMSGGPVPPRIRESAPAEQRAPRAVHPVGPEGGHAVPAETVPAEFTGRFTNIKKKNKKKNRKKVIWKKTKRSGADVESEDSRRC